MEIREELIVDIQTYIERVSMLFEQNKHIEKMEYENLKNRILSLTENEFENIEKYRHFLNFINQAERRIKTMMLEDLFRENNIEVGALLFLVNYFHGVVNCLK